MKLDRKSTSSSLWNSQSWKVWKSWGNYQINLKFRPIIDQAGRFVYKSAKVISNYLRPWVKTNIPSMIRKIPKYVIFIFFFAEDVSYDVELLFINIPLEETINCIIEQIYIKKKKGNSNLFEIYFHKIIDKTCYRMYI